MGYATNNIKNSQLTALYRIHTYVLYARYIGRYIPSTYFSIDRSSFPQKNYIAGQDTIAHA